VMVMSSIDSERLVFVDECSTNTSLAPLYGWSRRGERVRQKVPRNWGKNVTLLSSIGKRKGMGASVVVEGSTNTKVFETYLTEVLLPTLEEGQVVVMDNLSSHKGQRVRELIEGEGCELIYLPSYSPDFNPIEQAFSKLKGYLREACARSHEMLMEVIGEALRKISASDAESFFDYCGYRTVVQSL
jgi:transposase